MLADCCCGSHTEPLKICFMFLSVGLTCSKPLSPSLCSSDCSFSIDVEGSPECSGRIFTDIVKVVSHRDLLCA